MLEQATFISLIARSLYDRGVKLVSVPGPLQAYLI